MENFEFQKYRDDLAQKITQEPDHTKRREILSLEKMTPEYQEAKKLRRLEFGSEKNKNDNDQLISYAEEHYGEYKIFTDELRDLINTIVANRNEFETVTKANIPEELLNQILDFCEGMPNEQIESLLNRANFNYENLLAGEVDEYTKAKLITEAVLKAKSYDLAVEENRGKEIDFIGFEKDQDIPDAKDFIYQTFSRGLLEKCLISKIDYNADKVNVALNGTDYVLPIEIYSDWQKIMPGVKNHKYRAESMVLWNTDPKFSKKFIPTPIRFFSFYGEEPNKLDYLKDVLDEKKMRQYKLGTIAHEVAHHIYEYLIDADKRNNWKEIVDRSGSITNYAQAYKNHNFKYDEFFTEAVRLKTTVPDYLERNFPEINQFITDNFPEIQAPIL